jgi:hypothetical protein
MLIFGGERSLVLFTCGSLISYALDFNGFQDTTLVSIWSTAALMAAELGWNAARVAAEIGEYTARATAELAAEQTTNDVEAEAAWHQVADAAVGKDGFA